MGLVEVRRRRYGDVSKTYLHHDVMYNFLRNANVPIMYKIDLITGPWNKYSSKSTTLVGPE